MNNGIMRYEKQKQTPRRMENNSNNTHGSQMIKGLHF